MAPTVDTSRKRQASASPEGSPQSVRSLLSQGVSNVKKKVRKGITRAVSVLRSHSRSVSPKRGPSRQSMASGDDMLDDMPSLRSVTSDGASSFHFDPATFDEDDLLDAPGPSSHQSKASSLIDEPIDIPTDRDESSSEDDRSISGQGPSGDESNPEPRGRRGKPAAVSKRGGTRRSSPKRNAFDVLGKGKGKAQSPGARRRSNHTSKPSEKVREPLPTESPEPVNTRKKKKSPSRKKKGKASAQPVDLSSLPKATNIAESSDEEVQRKTRTSTRRSAIFGFYEPEIGLVHRETDAGKHIPHDAFRCYKCRGWVYRNRTTQDKSSGSGLRTHANKCFGVEAVKAAMESKDLEGTRKSVQQAQRERQTTLTGLLSKLVDKGKEVYATIALTKAEVRAECARWCAENYRPFKIVADRAFKKLMKTGRPAAYVPHPTTVSRDTKTLFAKTRRRLAKHFKTLQSRIHIVTDAWTSPNHKAFVGYSAQWEEDGEIVSTILDFCELGESHTGEALAILTKRVLEEFGIEEKVLSVTCDNASPNDVMIDRLVDGIPSFGGSRSRTRCFAHVVNLVAKSLLRLFEQPSKKKKDDEHPEDEGAGEGESHNPGGDSIDVDDLLAQLRDLEMGVTDRDDPNDTFDPFGEMSAEEKQVFLDEVKAVCSALRKIRTISNKIINSSTILLPRWKEIVADVGLPPKILPRDVSTRWNSTYDMLVTAIQYRRAIRDITSEDILLDYALTGTEWMILDQLREVLKALKDATLYFSRDDANLASVIPAMDKLGKMFSTAVIRKSKTDKVVLCKPLKAALLIAKDTLDKYYSLSDSSEVYRLAVILHPKYKLAYFDELQWLDDWKQDASNLVKRVFNEYLTAYTAAAENATASASKTAQTSSTVDETRNIFDSDDDDPVTATTASDAASELTRYLAAKQEKNVSNPIAWWHDNRAEYPVLSRMALDYLSIPPTSVAVERMFSQARILISHIRNRRTAQTARALMCLGAWSRDGMIHASDLEAVTSTPVIAEEGEDGDVLMPADFDAISRG